MRIPVAITVKGIYEKKVREICVSVVKK